MYVYIECMYMYMSKFFIRRIHPNLIPHHVTICEFLCTYTEIIYRINMHTRYEFKYSRRRLKSYDSDRKAIYFSYLTCYLLMQVSYNCIYELKLSSKTFRSFTKRFCLSKRFHSIFTVKSVELLT